jgi:hypothetical protein
LEPDVRRDPTKAQRSRLYAKNARMCCVCKSFEVGLELHHIDGENSNTIDENLAVLCVTDHDAHHRPGQYRVRHTELTSTEIARFKRDWEDFVREAALPKPRLLVTVGGYGTREVLHSAKAVYQWTDGRIVFERIYHLHAGTIGDWTTDIVNESVRLGRNIPIVLLDKPLDVAYCSCCRKSLSNVVDRGYGLRLVAPNWDADSAGVVYINPEQPSLAVTFSLDGREIFSASLHFCGGTHLDFECGEYSERVAIKPGPSVRDQVAQMLDNLLRDWCPARLLIGTGDHDNPDLMDGLRLPDCWEVVHARKHAR